MHSRTFRFIQWAPDPVMFTLGQRQFRWYAWLFVGGLLGGYVIAVLIFLRERIDIAYANILLVFVAIGAVVGARLGEVFLDRHPAHAVAVRESRDWQAVVVGAR
jgi:prolipoprotein diacylglyceryltransferase